MLSQFKRNSIHKYSILVLTILLSTLFSQDIKNQISLQSNSNISNQWWATQNSYGLKPSKVNFFYTSNYQKKKFGYNIIVSNSGNRTIINESFLKFNLQNNNHIKVGKYYRDFSTYLNDELTSGSLLISYNAEPMQKIGFITSYDFKKNMKYSLNFGIAHAIFDKNETYKSKPMLHEKFIYLNYINQNYELGMGFVHEAMWGGETENYGKFPTSFKDFLKILISADGPLVDGEPHANALGNHLGIWDFYYKRYDGNKILKMYYQHFFEDTSGLRFANKFDGLWGIELNNYIQNTTVLIEYLSTINQDSSSDYLIDSYYNNTEYSLGWSYKNYTLGNPYIDHLDQNPLEALHLGIAFDSSKKYHYKFLVNRKINTNDYLKYKFILGKKIKKTLFDIIVIGGKKNTIGIKMSYNL
jgi:hypothetical protein